MSPEIGCPDLCAQCGLVGDAFLKRWDAPFLGAGVDLCEPSSTSRLFLNVNTTSLLQTLVGTRNSPGKALILTGRHSSYSFSLGSTLSPTLKTRNRGSACNSPLSFTVATCSYGSSLSVREDVLAALDKFKATGLTLWDSYLSIRFLSRETATLVDAKLALEAVPCWCQGVTARETPPAIGWATNVIFEANSRVS